MKNQESEADFVDIISFFWRQRLILGSFLLAGLISTIAFQYLYTGKYVYNSRLAVGVSFPTSYNEKERVKKLVNSWGDRINERSNFSEFYQTLKSISPKATLKDESFMHRQQLLDVNPYPKAVVFSMEESSGKTFIQFNLQEKLEGSELTKLAETLLSDILTQNSLETTPKKTATPSSQQANLAPAKPVVSFPGYDYAKLEYKLYKLLKNSSEDYKQYISTFHTIGPSMAGLDLLRLIAVLEENKLLDNAQVKDLIISVYKIVPILMNSGAYAKEQPEAVKAIPIENVIVNESPTLQGFKIENSNELSQLNIKAKALYRAIIFSSFLIMGFVTALVLEFYFKNKDRLRNVFLNSQENALLNTNE